MMNADEARIESALNKNVAEAAFQSRIKYYHTCSTEERVAEEMKRVSNLIIKKRGELELQIRSHASRGLREIRNFQIHDWPISEFDPVSITVLEEAVDQFEKALTKKGFQVKTRIYKYYGGQPFDGEGSTSPITFEWKMGAVAEVKW